MNLFDTDVTDVLGRGAGVGAFFGGLAAVVLRRSDIDRWAAAGAVYGGLAALAAELARAVR